MNGRLWGGLLLSFVAAFSYRFFFVRFPITRDVPWVNILLFLAALFLLITGFRRARRKIAAGIVMVLGVGLGVLFGVSLVVMSKAPASPDAPRVGQKAFLGMFVVSAIGMAALVALVRIWKGGLLVGAQPA